MQDYQATLDSDTNNPPNKQVVSRGARACTVCRAAKMKCVGAEDDGAKPCQRCRRSNSECIFEKHRRGRKPGSKLSEASKMLRKIEKSSSTPAKIRSMSDVPSYVPSQSSPPLHPPPPPPPPPPPSQPQQSSQHPHTSSSSASSASSSRNLFPTLTSSFPPTGRYPTLPSLQASSSPPLPPQGPSPSSSSSSNTPQQQQQQQQQSSAHSQDVMEEDEEDEKDEETMYPAKMVEREGRRHNFFGTVLTNPIPKPSTNTPAASTTPIPTSSTSASASTSTTNPPSSHTAVHRRSEERRHKEDRSAPSSSSRHHRHHHARLLSPGATSSSTHQQQQLHPPNAPPSTAPLPQSNNYSAAALRYFPFMTSRFLQNPVPVPDPVKEDILSSSDVSHLFDMIFLRLNPFVNLFDPALHTPTYVREACPFLFTVLCMAGCKFFKPEKYRAVQRMAEELCVRAFQEGWKRVEVVQAFMCMTYWREPDDQRTWTFIGYAARMAVELGLNTYYHPAAASAPLLPNESPPQLHQLQRRNRERTYLVLWVHDRSLSMQTGRQWMLPEDDLVRNAVHWYRESHLLPIDTVVAAQVELRRIAASVIDIFYLHRARSGDVVPADINYDVLLSACNTRLQVWNDDWMNALQKTNGTQFHTSFLTFFKLHVRLFLNSFGLQSSLLVHHSSSSSSSSSSPETRPPIPNIFALSTCYSSASDTLQLVAQDFAKVDMLRYGQDSITVMTAYSAVFLLKLLRNVIQTSPLSLGENPHERIYDLINAAADAYQACAKSMAVPSNSGGENRGNANSTESNSGEKMETDHHHDTVTSNHSSNTKHGEPPSNGSHNPSTGIVTNSTMFFSTIEYHGRFLRTLVRNDKASRARAAERERRKATTAAANDMNKVNNHNHGGVSRISTSSLPDSAASSGQVGGASSSGLVVSPTTSAAATVLLGGSFSGANTKGLNGLAAAATSSAHANGGINGSSSSPRNPGEIIIPSSSSNASGSGGGTPTGHVYHQLPSGSSPYIVPSSSSTYQAVVNSHLHYASSQSSHSQHMSGPHNENNQMSHSHSRSSFSHVPQHQRGSSSQGQQQQQQQQMAIHHSPTIQQSYNNNTVPSHPNPSWHFPASPRLPAYPLVSNEDELGPLELDGVVDSNGKAAMTSGMMYNQPSDSMNTPTANTNTTGRVMNNLDDSDMGGDGTNRDAVVDAPGNNMEGIPQGASAADIAYWYYMHSEIGYGNGVMNPLASVGVGGNSGSYGSVVGSSMGMNMGVMGGGGGGGGMGLANMGNNTGMGVMNGGVPGMSVPNAGNLDGVGHSTLSGMGGMGGGMLTSRNDNMSDNGGAGSSSSPEGVERGGPGPGTSSGSSGPNPKHRVPSNHPSAGYQQHHGMSHHPQSQSQSQSHHGSHPPNHGSTSSHHIPTAYQAHGHSVMQNG